MTYKLHEPFEMLIEKHRGQCKTYILLYVKMEILTIDGLLSIE
jgi:hypothetical protein